jgi:hypothetical protein
MMSQQADRSGAAARARRQRNRTITILGVIGAAAFVGGVTLANLNDGGTGAASASLSHTQRRSTSPTASATPSTSSSPSPARVPDGRYFVKTHGVEPGDGGRYVLTYDLAYFYTGDDAVRIARQRGDPPPESGYYIVNDNPRLRVALVASDARVAYVPEGACCELADGDLDAWALSVNDAAQTDYPDPASAWWWITVTSGEITSIEQQYLP